MTFTLFKIYSERLHPEDTDIANSGISIFITEWKYISDTVPDYTPSPYAIGPNCMSRTKFISATHNPGGVGWPVLTATPCVDGCGRYEADHVCGVHRTPRTIVIRHIEDTYL